MVSIALLSLLVYNFSLIETLFFTTDTVKIGIIGWVWDNDQSFGNFEEILCEGILFYTKTSTSYQKGVFVPMFWLKISSSIINLAEDMKVLEI